jgi:cobalt-zinc-cadmium efflux system membrane fusion protein
MKILNQLCCGLTAVLLCACHREAQKPSDSVVVRAEGNKVVMPEGSPQFASVNVEPAQLCTASLAHMPGRLVWDEDVTVRIFTPFTGRITKINTEVGREVKKGDILAEIASPEYGQAQADYRAAVSAFVLAERNLSRTRDLFEHGAAAQKDLFSAEADYERAKSEQERTTARLALYGGGTNSVDQVYYLRSPLDGVVEEKNINPGQEVRADAMLANAQQFFAPLFVVTDPTRLWIQLDATEQDLPHLKRDQDIVIRTKTFQDIAFSGKLDLIGDSLDSATRTIKVRGHVDNSRRLLKAEMFVSADVPTSPGLVGGADVSAKAVFFKGDKRYVFLEETPGRYERREVKVGSEHDGKILLLDGVHPGDRVVTDGCLLLDQVIEASTGS